jgi:hypothetical protein
MQEAKLDSKSSGWIQKQRNRTRAVRSNDLCFAKNPAPIGYFEESDSAFGAYLSRQRSCQWPPFH